MNVREKEKRKRKGMKGEEHKRRNIHFFNERTGKQMVTEGFGE